MNGEHDYRLSAEEYRRLLDSINKPFDPCAKLKSAIARTSENNMKGYDEWKCTDSDGERMEEKEAAFYRRRQAIHDNYSRMEELDLDVSNKFDSEVLEMFWVLANASETGLISRLAGGASVPDTWSTQHDTCAQQEAFAALAKLADRMAALRAKAVSDAAEDDDG